MVGGKRPAVGPFGETRPVWTFRQRLPWYPCGLANESVELYRDRSNSSSRTDDSGVMPSCGLIGGPGPASPFTPAGRRRHSGLASRSPCRSHLPELQITVDAYIDPIRWIAGQFSFDAFTTVECEYRRIRRVFVRSSSMW